MPEGSTHVCFFFPVMAEPEAIGLDVPPEVFRRALKAAMRTEGVPLDEWQRVPVPGQTLFQEMRGYGRGCPWTCGHAQNGTRYDPDAYLAATDICRRRLVLTARTAATSPPPRSTTPTNSSHPNIGHWYDFPAVRKIAAANHFSVAFRGSGYYPYRFHAIFTPAP